MSIVALGALALPAARAQGLVDGNGTDSGAASGSQWGLGFGAAMDRAPYRDFDDKVQPIPLIYFENRWVSVLGPSLDVKLPSAGAVSFRLRARYSGDGYEADDSPFLTGMDKRKDSIWVGGAAIWRNDIANLSAEWLGDASGNSKGQKFKLQVDRRFQSGAFDFTPRLAAHWVDTKYVDYHYGVKASEARADRPAYQGDASVNIELGLRIGYALAPKQNVFLDLSTTGLGSGIKDSPLVERSNKASVRVGYLYRF